MGGSKKKSWKGLAGRKRIHYTALIDDNAGNNGSSS